jgi:hypothetical protein
MTLPKLFRVIVPRQNLLSIQQSQRLLQQTWSLSTHVGSQRNPTSLAAAMTEPVSLSSGKLSSVYTSNNLSSKHTLHYSLNSNSPEGVTRPDLPKNFQAAEAEPRLYKWCDSRICIYRKLMQAK